MSINRANISGNLVRDAELRSTAAGTQILTFTVAVNDRRKNPQTQQWENVPNYIDCVVFGSRAEAIGRFIRKGSKVAIEGKLRWSQWEDRQTHKKRSKIEVIVDEVEFLSDSKAQNRPQGQQTGDYTNHGSNAPNTASQQPQGDFYDESIPF